MQTLIRCLQAYFDLRIYIGYFNFLAKDINKSLSYIQLNRSVSCQEATKGEPLTSFLNFE